MSKANNNKQSNDSILRAEDVIPPYGKKTSQPSFNKGRTTGLESSLSQRGSNHLQENSNLRNNQKDSTPSDGLSVSKFESGKRENSIPKFDLAEDIMAQQREITAKRRKAPNKQVKVQDQKEQSKTTTYISYLQTPILNEQEQVIVEIVARDIEKLRMIGTANIPRPR